MENLWSLDEDMDLESPVDILRGQIDFLEKLTDKYVSAELVEEKKETSQFQYDFVINSPYLPNYSFKAFTIRCTPILYPISIDCDDNIFEELGIVVDPALYLRDFIECSDTEAFKIELKKILGTKYMKQVVAAVKVMAKSYL